MEKIADIEQPKFLKITVVEPELVKVTLQITKGHYDMLNSYFLQHRALYWNLEDLLIELIRRGQETLRS